MVTLIETVIASMSVPMSFFYAEKYEFNLKADGATVWPIAVLLPITKAKKVDIANKVITEHNLQLFFINKTSFLRDSQGEALPVIEALDTLADEFLIRLGKAKKWYSPINKTKFELYPIPQDFDLPGDGYYIGGTVIDSSTVTAC